jgi:hypothetical protein
MDQDVVTRATAALKTSVGLILDSDGSEEEKRSELAESFAQFQMHLDREIAGKSLGKGVLERETRRIRKGFEKIFARKADDDSNHDTSDDSIRAPVSDHHISRLADLVAEGSGGKVDRASALHWLLHPRNGVAMARTHKKEEPMDRIAELTDIMKRNGLQSLCKHLVETGAHGISESEFTAAVTAHAKAQHAELTEAGAFSKVFTANTEEGTLVRKAHAVVKAAAPYFDPQVQVVGGANAFNVDDPSEALAALHRIGRERWPEASEAIRFTRAFEANPELAAKAHRRPTAPPAGAYAWPK